MQGVEKFSQRCIWVYVSKKFFPQRSSWDEIWIFTVDWNKAPD